MNNKKIKQKTNSRCKLDGTEKQQKKKKEKQMLLRGRHFFSPCFLSETVLKINHLKQPKGSVKIEIHEQRFVDQFLT